jgi:hypothetical protein
VQSFLQLFFFFFWFSNQTLPHRNYIYIRERERDLEFNNKTEREREREREGNSSITIDFDFFVEVIDVNSHVRRDFSTCATIIIDIVIHISHVFSLQQCHDFPLLISL